MNFGHPNFKKKKIWPKMLNFGHPNFKKKKKAQNAEFWLPKFPFVQSHTFSQHVSRDTKKVYPHVKTLAPLPRCTRLTRSIVVMLK